MTLQELINKYAHCDYYHIGSEEYDELNSLSYDEYKELYNGLNQMGYSISYNNLEDCYCVH